MSYSTVGDILQYSKDLHVHARKLYEQLKDSSQRERVDMMLDLLSEHEKTLGAQVADLHGSASKAVLNEWHQFEPKKIEEVLVNCQALNSEMSVDNLVDVALKIDDFMIDFYRQIASEATSRATREIFTNLIQLEENEKMQIVRASLSAYDW